MRFGTALIGCFLLASLAECGGYTAPASYGGDAGGGPVGGGSGNGGGPAGAVTVGSGIQFVSSHNGSQNPAVDTISVGDAVTWTWTGALPHSVESTGSTSFASSDIKTGSGTHVVKFSAAGTYRYDCAVHGAAMSGIIVVK